ncbi:ATP-binding protein [Saccharothrix longispora]|uniref:Anti-sigma regulatory factor (Ser/Thr protein kinase) n=1 Tax=Saccharothrix longispora TaxID=33920 RepID=A0ABU1PSD6_9PSEU|nr:ATP-binding protein [Saccharothrix longispora]MDR6593558.1 anti-sigma regulatory factor (Ser/Thr protein kinase) [Saccharothrix longispora]
MTSRFEPEKTPEGEDSDEGDGLSLDTSVRCGSLAVMRAQVGSLLQRFGEDFVQDAQLVCHELVANACDHADKPHHLSVRCHTRYELLIEVRDASTDRAPRIGASTAGPNRGNGMKMVEALSSDWGVRRTDNAKVVWARLRIPA